MFITLAACHANYDKAPSGLIYKIYPGKGGAKLSTAQFVKLNIEYSIKKNGKDSILSSSFGKMPQFSAIDTTPARVAYTYMEILPKCNVGDSIVFTLSVDTLRARNVGLPPTFAKGDFIKGKIKILNAFTSRDQIMADFKKEQDLDIARQSKQIVDYLAKNNINAQKNKERRLCACARPRHRPQSRHRQASLCKIPGVFIRRRQSV